MSGKSESRKDWSGDALKQKQQRRRAQDRAPIPALKKLLTASVIIQMTPEQVRLIDEEVAALRVDHSFRVVVSESDCAEARRIARERGVDAANSFLKDVQKSKSDRTPSRSSLVRHIIDIGLAEYLKQKSTTGA